MSVLNSQPVEYQRFNGYIERALPEGWWHGAVRGTGDGTGGTNNLALQFNQVGTVLSSRIFSLEQLAIYSGVAGALSGRLEQINLSSPESGDFRGIYTLNLGAHTEGTALRGSDLAFLPLFLGSQRDSALVASLAFVIANTDGGLVTLEAQGYWWGARSVSESGGPRRAPSGVYRT